MLKSGGYGILRVFSKLYLMIFMLYSWNINFDIDINYVDTNININLICELIAAISFIIRTLY